MRADYASAYRSLYADHWWWRAREALLLGEIERHAPPAGWGRILDVGCGDGLFFDRLARFGIVRGVEVDPTLVSEKSRHRPAIHVGPFDATFRPEMRFGLILMLDVLEHLSNPIAALSRARELLAPGGRLLITVPAFNSLWTRHDEMNHHIVRYRRDALAHVVAEGGLVVLTARYYMHWLFLAKLAVRTMERLRSGPARPPVVPPAWLNGLLFGLSRAEESVPGLRRLPVGSSLLAWCRAPTAPSSATDGLRAG